tara:strand:- start:72 stop:1403 length:1332 start_codon:yes stop_codon:yes gene_type:complete
MENNFINILSKEENEKIKQFFKINKENISINNKSILIDNSIYTDFVSTYLITQNYNNNILYINNFLKQILDIDLEHFKVYNINYKELNLESNNNVNNGGKNISTGDPDNPLNLYKYKNIFYIDIKKLKYINYPIFFKILNYYSNSSKIDNNLQYIFILNNVYKLIDIYIYRICNIMEQKNENCVFLFFNHSYNNMFNSKIYKSCLKYIYPKIVSHQLIELFKLKDFTQEYFILFNEKVKKINLKFKLTENIVSYIKNKLDVIFNFTDKDIIKTYLIVIGSLHKEFSIGLQNIDSKVQDLIDSSTKNNKLKLTKKNKEIIINEFQTQLTNGKDLDYILKIPLFNILYKLIHKLFNVKKINDLDLFHDISYKLISLTYEINIIIKGFIKMLKYLNSKNEIKISIDKLIQIISKSSEIESKICKLDKPFMGLNYFFIECHSIIYEF